MDKPLKTYSFHLEVWVEHREIPGLPLQVRARMRDMEHDKARYVGSMSEIEEMINERLDVAGLVPRRWEHQL